MLYHHLETAMARRVMQPRPVKTPPMMLPRAGTHLGEATNYWEIFCFCFWALLFDFWSFNTSLPLG